MTPSTNSSGHAFEMKVHFPLIDCRVTVDARTSEFILGLAQTEPKYRREPENDCAAGSRSDVGVCAWVQLGLGIVYYAAGVDPNATPEARRIEVKEDEWAFSFGHLR